MKHEKGSRLNNQ